MAVRNGILSTSTPGKALYDLLAVDLAANPNWSQPSVPTLTGATNSHGANWTSKIWKCTVGTSVFHVIFSYDTTTTPLALYVQLAEAYDGSDGGGSPIAAKFRRTTCGGTISTTTDGTTVTPGATDIVNAADVFLNATSPNFEITNLLGTGSAFPYLFKVGNKSVTIGYNVAGANRWVHVGAFESLVTGPADPMPVGKFSHGVNNPVNMLGVISSAAHCDGTVTRNPGLGTTGEKGAFFAQLSPLHAPPWMYDSGTLVMGSASPPSAQSFGATVPRWYTKVLMSQAVVHQSREGGSDPTNEPPQTFRGYYPDLFAGLMTGTTEPVGGGVDSVIIDGVQYYWLGLNCPGAGETVATTLCGTLIAVRAD